MEETETRLANVKSMISLLEVPRGQFATNRDTTQLERCCREVHRRAETEINRLKKDNQTLITDMQKTQMELAEIKKTTERLQEKQKEYSRLGTVAGNWHVGSNSVTAYLADPNRPMKIGEIYGETFDDEWTDAFEALIKDGHKDKAAVEILRFMFEDVVKFCEYEVRPFLGTTMDELQRILGQYRTSERLVQILEAKTGLKEEERIETCDMVPGKKKPDHETNRTLEAIKKKLWANLASFAEKEFREATLGIEYISNLKPFVLKCLRVGWMMVIQAPPMALHKCPTDDDSKFDKNLYTKYRRSGPLVDYLVWPVL
ncbi:uncharacterized protein LOC128552788 [Mercenaria mercenaria]|uniref:uncharacterized protein LOC128552788 n=1 Tax=Mercenaria mercenaria TaxID=6596 RepID=UPI00234F1A70|nr:uncharacterized protein LOC128552788 [Mercenaria mercenaria]